MSNLHTFVIDRSTNNKLYPTIINNNASICYKGSLGGGEYNKSLHTDGQ